MKKLFFLVLLGYTSTYAQTQIGADIDGEAADDYSGWSVSLSSDGTTVAIGAPDNNGSGAYAGSVRVYKNVSGTWTPRSRANPFAWHLINKKAFTIFDKK